MFERMSFIRGYIPLNTSDDMTIPLINVYFWNFVVFKGSDRSYCMCIFWIFIQSSKCVDYNIYIYIYIWNTHQIWQMNHLFYFLNSHSTWTTSLHQTCVILYIYIYWLTWTFLTWSNAIHIYFFFLLFPLSCVVLCNSYIYIYIYFVLLPLSWR